MTIQSIGDRSAALYFTVDDLATHGVTPQQLTLDNTLFLAREAFLQAHLPLWEEMEIEVYPNTDGALVFVHRLTPQRCYYTFSCWEHLLAGAAALTGQNYTVDVLFYQERYWLQVAGKALEHSCVLSEFGTAQALSPIDWARVAEYGNFILKKAPLSLIFSTFFV